MKSSRRLGAVTIAAVACLALAACSSGSGSGAGDAQTPSTIGPQSSLAEMTGYRCVDPKSDISSDLKGQGRSSDPAGIDILVAEAQVEGSDLVVTYTMAGDVGSAPAPLVDLLQGSVTAPDFSFELRSEPIAGASPESPWGLTLITFKGQETRKALTTAVTVKGDTVTYRVPLADIPPIATLQWTFGSSSTGANDVTLFDDCSNLAPSSTSDTQADAPGVSLPSNGPAEPTTTG